MNQNLFLLIGKSICFGGTDSVLYTIKSFNSNCKKYKREYSDNTSESMPTDILLKKLEDKSLVCLELTPEQLKLVVSNRPKTANEKAFDKQLERAENPHKYMREY